jgi:lysophospholipase L1-like esterase
MSGSPWRPSCAGFLILLVTAVASGCSNSPSAPSQLTSPIGSQGSTFPGCQGTLDAYSYDGGPVAVTYPQSLPGVVSNTETVTCTPPSGSLFPVGSTNVMCVAQGSAGVRSWCALSVSVLIRRLTRRRFLAFGDSITAGYIPPPTTTSASASLPLDWSTIPLAAGSSSSYPFKLEKLLIERHPVTPITVENAGVGGETTGSGRRRLPEVLDRFQPEVLLLLEGSNDLGVRSAQEVVDNLRTMVSLAQGRGVAVLIATLTPLSAARERESPGITARLQEVNVGISRIAAELGLGRAVDLFSVFSANPSYLSADGKHPTELGHSAIAETFYRAILDRFEMVSSTSSTSSTDSGAVTVPFADSGRTR